MKSLKNLSVIALVLHIRKVKCKSLGNNDKEVKAGIIQCFKYFKPSGKLSLRVAKAVHCENSVTLSLMFMPFLIHTGRIILTNNNARHVMYWLLRDIVELSVLHKIKVIDAGECFNTICDKDYGLMELLFTKLPNVNKIVLGAIPDDRFFYYIHKTCHRLVYLDVYVDHLCGISDAGLKIISFFKHLKYLFIRLSSLFFMEIKVAGHVLFTAEGISNLLRCLPEMIEFECPHDIFVDAFQNLQNTNHQLLKLKTVPFSITSQTAVICKTCPNIVQAQMCVRSDEDLVDLDRLLLRLDSLHRLLLDLRETIEIISWSIVGPKLTVLTIYKMNFVESNFLLLGRNCPNLVDLTVTGMSNYERPDDNFLSKPSDENEFIFPSLSNLKFRLICFQNVRLFFHPKSRLTTLDISLIKDYEYSDFVNTVRLLQNVICLPMLGKVIFTKFRCPADVVQIFFDKLPSLKKVSMS